MSGKTPPSGSLETLGHEQDVSGAFMIRKMTASFDLDEDRVRLDAADALNRTQVIYFTKRLLDRLIPVLGEKLLQTETLGPAAKLVQEFAQANVRMHRQHMPQQAPVSSHQDAPKWLCTKVRVSGREEGIILIFSDRGECASVLPLMWKDIRSFLDILMVTYTHGSWTTSIFPEWIAPRSQTLRQPPTHRMH